MWRQVSGYFLRHSKEISFQTYMGHSLGDWSPSRFESSNVRHKSQFLCCILIGSPCSSSVSFFCWHRIQHHHVPKTICFASESPASNRPTGGFCQRRPNSAPCGWKRKSNLEDVFPWWFFGHLFDEGSKDLLIWGIKDDASTWIYTWFMFFFGIL